MVNRPDLPSFVDKADDLQVLSALLRCAGLPATPHAAERVWPFWAAARRRASHVEANVTAGVVPAHTRWRRS